MPKCENCKKNEIDSIYGYCVDCLSFYSMLARNEFYKKGDDISQEFWDTVLKVKNRFNFITDMERAREEHITHCYREKRRRQPMKITIEAEKPESCYYCRFITVVGDHFKCLLSNKTSVTDTDNSELLSNCPFDKQEGDN